MRDDGGSRSRGPGPGELEALYSQVAQSAARLMVVHEASKILRSTHNEEELARGLLDVIGEAVFAGTGCVASLKDDELKILAVRGLEEDEADTISGDPGEAAVWFEVVEGDEPRLASELTGVASRARESGVEDEEEELGIGEEGSEDAAEDGDEDWLTEAEESSDEGYETGSTAPAFELYLPLKIEEEPLGVLALGKRVDGRSYAEEDTRLAVSLASHLSLALDHASLLSERSRRIEQLSVLLQISREITSTLDLEKVLTTIAHMLGMVLSSRRTTVALTSGGSVNVRASSDPALKTSITPVHPILPVLKWSYGARRSLNTCLSDLESDPEAEGRDVLLGLLNKEGGPQGISVMPLEDDQGILGVLAIETDTDAPPLDDDTEELIGILANQTTVAIRNAELYQQIPMIGVLEPMLGKARKVVSQRRKLGLRMGLVVAVLILGFLVPIPSWVTGKATLRPVSLVPIRAATEGMVEKVWVEEGQAVSAGTALACLRRDELEVELEQVRASTQRVRAEAASARSMGDLATFSARQATLSELSEKADYLITELDRTEMVAPIHGVVLTPDLHLRHGEHLVRGEVLLYLGDLSAMEAEVVVTEEDVERVAPGGSARLKVHAYPGRTFKGRVIRIAPRSEPDGTFRTTLLLPNDDGALRPGMTGRAHLAAPGQPLLSRALRPLIHWVRLKCWF